MPRPSVTVVVPSGGPAAELSPVARRFATLRTSPGDEVIVVANRAAVPPVGGVEGVRVVADARVPAPGYARNVGAREARGDWILFCDDDTEPAADLLDAYFARPPGERTAILAGAVEDAAEGDSLAERLACETAAMSQRQTLDNPYMPFAITANCAFRADAFRAAGGFDEEIFLGEDADLCWRLQRAGWEIEERPEARVMHRSRATMSALWRQRMRHGAGADWLRRRYPGAMPRWGLAALVRDSALRLAGGLRALLRGDRARAALEVATVSGWWAFELGRRTSNASKPTRVTRWIRR